MGTSGTTLVVEPEAVLPLALVESVARARLAELEEG